MAREQRSEKTAPGVDWDAGVRAHNHRVIVSLLAAGAPIDQAKDIAQTAWLRVFERYQRGELGRCEFPGLILKQARYLAIDEFRRRSAEGRRLAIVDAEQTSLAELAVDPEQKAIAEQQLAVVAHVLARCSASAQKIFRLLAEDPALPHAVAAERLGLSTQRVRQVICEVRKKLRLALEGRER